MIRSGIFQYFLVTAVFYSTLLCVYAVEQQQRQHQFEQFPPDTTRRASTLAELSQPSDSDFDSMPFGFSPGAGGGRETDSGATAVAQDVIYRPPQVPLDVENYPIAPEPLRLEQVHVYVRHGERTPVGVRLVNAPANIPQYWNMCRAARRFESAVSSVLQPQDHHDTPKFEGVLQTRKIVERADGSAVEGECLLGELTDLGRQSTFNFGKNLRRLYVERLGFLPDVLENQETAYFRTTNMPRTTETLQEIICGLYPEGKCLPSSMPPIRVRNGKDENLVGNTYSCKRLQALLTGFAKAAAVAYNPTLEHLDKKLSKYIDGNPIRVDGRPRASGILDTVRSAIAHGLKVPQEFEDKSIIDEIEYAVVNEWFADKTEEVRRLGMGRLFGDLVNKIQHKVQHDEQDPLKILVHSTHDTAIAAIHQTLDVYDDKWPAFTASITFEVFKAQTPSPDIVEQTQTLLSRLGGRTPSQHYVRMRSQNKSFALPMCAGEGKHLPGHPEFCTLDAFRSRMNELIPKDWDNECNVSSTT